MKVILTETIEKVGKVGQIINVKDGFARNYLFPNKYAIMGSKDNLKKIEKIEAEARKKADKKNEEFRVKAYRISELEAEFVKKADAEGKLFGSVSEVDIVNFLNANDISCVKSQIMLDNHIKHVGETQVKIAFTSEISATLKIKVLAEE